MYVDPSGHEQIFSSNNHPIYGLDNIKVNGESVETLFPERTREAKEECRFVIEKLNKVMAENNFDGSPVASKNPSLIVGRDTRWRGEWANPYPYTGDYKDSTNEQMDPCNTCRIYAELYMRIANKDKEY